MKDLYARLNLDPKVSPQDIRSRLENVSDHQLERAARKILLHPQRREVYDRNHRTLRLVGQLRQELELTDASNWKQTGSDDFVSPPDTSRESTSSTGAEASETRGASTSKNREASAGTRSRDPSTGTADQTASSDTSFFESVAEVISGTVRGVFGCLVSIFVRFAGLAVVLGGIALVAQVCSVIDQTSEPDDHIQTTESREQPSDESDLSTGREFSTEEPNRQSTEQESFSVPAEPLPSNGTWWRYTSEELIAPLRISVSEGQHYYVKLTDALTGETILTVFIRSGRTIEVEVPTGRYDLKYAIGDTWYGQEYLFGPETEYMKADDTLNFEIIGNQVRGHRIELIVQQGGNLRTDPIPESEF